MLEPLIDMAATARRMIADHGRDAANQAFMEALDESVIGDKAREAFWIDVAVQILTIQRRAPETIRFKSKEPAQCPSPSHSR
jgi:hypothetical protein